MADEEVQGVAEAIEALGGIDDAMDRAKALTKLLDDWPQYHSRVRALRQQAFDDLSKKGMSYREIATEMNMSAARVGQIISGVTNPRTQKNPPKKTVRSKATSDTTEDPKVSGDV